MDRKWSKSADLQLLLLLYICIPVCMTKAATDYFDRFHSTHFNNNNNNKNIDDAIILSLSLYTPLISPPLSLFPLWLYTCRETDRHPLSYQPINQYSNESCSRSDLDPAIRCRIKFIFHSAEPLILLDDQLWDWVRASARGNWLTKGDALIGQGEGIRFRKCLNQSWRGENSETKYLTYDGVPERGHLRKYQADRWWVRHGERGGWFGWNRISIKLNHKRTPIDHLGEKQKIYCDVWEINWRLLRLRSIIVYYSIYSVISIAIPVCALMSVSESCWEGKSRRA